MEAENNNNNRVMGIVIALVEASKLASASVLLIMMDRSMENVSKIVEITASEI